VGERAMRVRFWGVRGSCPTLLRSADIAARLQEALWLLGQEQSDLDLSDPAAIERWIAALPPHVRGIVGGNTPCVEMRTAADDLFIIDFGTGIRELGNELARAEFGRGAGHAHLFLSHYHWDHIQGWPFFRPAYIPGNRLEIYTAHENLQERLHRQQQAPFFPPSAWDDMRADITYTEMGDQPLTLCDGRVRVTTMELDHPSRAYAYRFATDDKVFVYASDGAYTDLSATALEPYIDFYRDADLLIFDAHFSFAESFEKASWGHSSAIVGVELALHAGVKKLALFHHAPGADDVTLEHLHHVAEQYLSTVPDVVYRDAIEGQLQIVLAREDMTIEL
ncbi:MAG TPA: MBL fold metallo-hydrolase, partial [Abditibacteriaceae bacterium]|nr:MBL fold metallo-hydrolase [Abditibacteriaceae bacterium]